MKSELLTFTVIGGGFSGVETVGEMKELIDRSLVFYPNIERREVRVLCIEFADRLLGELPPSFGAYAQRFLDKRGIEVRLKTGVREATGTAIVTTGGEVIGTRTVVATIGNAPSPLVSKLDLPNERGRIRTDRQLRVEGQGNIWALGDAALIPLVETPSERTDFAPPTAQFAVREARQLAINLAAALEGGNGTPFEYKSKGALASLGGGRGVAEVNGTRLSGFPAWLLWRAYYLSFVPGFATKARIAMQWLLDWLAGRSTVQTGTRSEGAARFVRYRAGDRVFEEGNRADGFYSVLEGAFELRIRGRDGRESVHRIGPGGHFGERVLLGEGLRTGTVRALEDSLVLFVKAQDFRRLVRALPPLRDYFDRYVSDTFRPSGTAGHEPQREGAPAPTLPGGSQKLGAGELAAEAPPREAHAPAAAQTTGSPPNSARNAE